MTYTPNIPQATDDPSQSQPLILSNFNQLNIQFSKDHVPLTSTSNNGKHEQTTWIDRTGDVISSVANELVVYGLTKSGITMPYYQRDGINPATTIWPLAPIKAFASFTTIKQAAPIVLAPLQSFNIAQIQQGNGTTDAIWTITMQQACRTNKYGVFASSNRGVIATTNSLVVATSPTGVLTFTLFIPNAIIANLNPVTLNCFVLEF